MFPANRLQKTFLRYLVPIEACGCDSEVYNGARIPSFDRMSIVVNVERLWLLRESKSRFCNSLRKWSVAQ